MLGGMGKPIGALVGGILLGLIEALTAGYISSVYKDAAAFVVILIVLFVMPSGIFGSKSTDWVDHDHEARHPPHPGDHRDRVAVFFPSSYYYRSVR